MFGLAGQLLGDAQVVVFVAGGQFGQADGGQQRPGLPADRGGAGPGEHGHAHPQRFAAGQPASEGKRVQSDVDVGVFMQQVGMKRRAPAAYPRRVDAVFGKGIDHALAQAGVDQRAPFQQQAGVGDGVQQACPQRQDGRVEFGGVVKTAKGDVALDQTGWRGHRGRRPRRGLVAKLAARQPPHGLDALRCHLGRSMPVVQQQRVDVAQAGGGKIAQPGGLHRGRAQGKGGQPRAGGVARQIHQHINAVSAHLGGQRGVVQCGHVAPLATGGDIAADPVRHAASAVGKYAHPRRVVRAQDVLHQQADGVLTKIRRHIAHPQRPAIQRRGRRARLAAAHPRLRPFTPKLRHGATHRRAGVRVVFQADQGIAADQRVIWQHMHQLLIQLARGAMFADFPIQIGQVDMGAIVLRRQADGLLQTGLRRADMPAAQQQRGHVQQGVDVLTVGVVQNALTGGQQGIVLAGAGVGLRLGKQGGGGHDGIIGARGRRPDDTRGIRGGGFGSPDVDVA